MIKVLNAILFILLSVAIERFTRSQTDGFHCNHILSSLTFNPEWVIKDDDIDLIKMYLSQPFYYLQSGGECYCFISEDRRFVFKVFKHHHLRVDHFLNRIPLPEAWDDLRLRLLGGSTSPQERLLRLFNSFKIAYNDLRDETGLLYLHLNKSEHLKQSITLIDKLGIRHRFDLDHLEFALQTKADLVYPTLENLVNTHEIVKAKACIHSLIHLFWSLDQRGIVDSDARLRRNFGFIGERAIRIDLGCLRKSPSTPHIPNKPHLIKRFQSLCQWLETFSPELALFTREELEKISEF